MRGARIIILAVAWVILSASAPQQEAQHTNSAKGTENTPPASNSTAPAPAAPVDQPVKFTSYPGYNPDPCYNAKDHDAADLCAQWRAALAAEKAAHEARRATDWAIVAAILGALSLGAVAYALKLTVDSNRTQRDAHRAWIKLSMVPRQVKPMQNGLYFRVDFMAENIGQTVATHFDFENEVFFIGAKENATHVAERIHAQVEEWKSGYDMIKKSVIAPNDTERDDFLDDRQPPILQWLATGETKRTKPIFVAAVFYRTVTHPELVQVSWRAWYLCSFHDNRQTAHWIPGRELGPDDLCVDAFRLSMMHQEYAAPEQDEATSPYA